MSRFLVALGASLLLDQITKLVAQQVGLHTVFNPGISFYWLAGVDQTLLTWLLLVLIVILAVGFRSLWLQYPALAGLFFGAAVSNWIDRVLWGGVRDWLVVPGFNLKNNVADWIIALSLLLLVWKELTKSVANQNIGNRHV